MAAKKGNNYNPRGRGKGTPNKSTALARTAIANFVDDNTQRMQGWLDEIAKDNPKDAFNCVKELMEYHLPKLARTEQTGLDGGDIKKTVTVSYVDSD